MSEIIIIRCHLGPKCRTFAVVDIAALLAAFFLGGLFSFAVVLTCLRHQQQRHRQVMKHRLVVATRPFAVSPHVLDRQLGLRQNYGLKWITGTYKGPAARGNCDIN